VRERSAIKIDRTSPLRLLVFPLLFNVVLKISLITANRAEFTDGILQILLFSVPSKLYPPLFTIIVMMLKPLIGDAEMAGRLISALASSITLIPIFFISMRLFDKRTAFYSALVYTVSPMALRWATHAMTDALFALLFFLAACECWKTSVQEGEQKANHLAMATVLTVLATMTRYQGVLLFPILLFLLVTFIMRQKKIPAWAMISQVLWILPVIWMVLYGFRHQEQFVERAGITWQQTLLNIFLLMESFLAYSPYFLTLPICFVFLAGIFYAKRQGAGYTKFLIIFGYLLLMLLILQSAFSSFQSRYLLPLLPFVSVIAGWGLRIIGELWKKKAVLFNLLIILIVIYGLGFGMASIFLQREAFGDLKDSALYLRALNLKETPIFSNENYRDLGPVKMRYWSGYPVRPLEPSQIQANSIVCLSSAYGGMGAFYQDTRWLRERHGARLIARFESTLVPLLPDIMQEPFTHQNPLALTFRYTPQHFRTEIYQIHVTTPDRKPAGM